MERCDINLLINKTQELLQSGMIDNGGLEPAQAMVEVQKLKGNDGKIYKLSVIVELYDPMEESERQPYPGNH